MTELRERLDALARLAGDDASAERMLGRVTPMVHAVRRRRTARHVGMSAAGLGTAAAVGLVGVAVGGGPAGQRDVGPAGTSPSGVWPAEATACGATVTPGEPASDGLRIVASLTGPVDTPRIDEVVANGGDTGVFLPSWSPHELLVLADGRVVARASLSASVGIAAPGGAAGFGSSELPLQACDTATLADGSYQLVVTATTGYEPHQVTTVGEATALVVDGGRASAPGFERLVEEVAPWISTAFRDTPDPVPFREGSDACAQPLPGLSDAPAVGSSVTLRASASIIGDVAVGSRPEIIVKPRNTGSTPLPLGLMLSARVVVFRGATPVVAYTADGAPLGPSGDAGGELTLEPDQEVGYVAGLAEPTWCLSGVDRLQDGEYTVATLAAVSVDGVSRSVVSLDTATAKDGVLTASGTSSPSVVRTPGGKG